MTITSVKNLYAAPQSFGDQSVTVAGWVRTVRDSKAFAFIELNDGSTVRSLQVVMDDNTDGFDEARRFNVGSAVYVSGVVVLTPNAKQPLEIKASSVRLEGASTPDYPLQKKRHSLEFLRTIAHLRPRTNTFNAVFRVRSEAAFAIHEFFNDRGFVYAHTPLITASDGEGAGEMFRVTTLEPGESDYSKDFFGKFTGLTVTGQLEAETFAQSFGKTYTFGPTFRAERSNTPRHAAEFWMIEPEIAFADLNDVMELAEAMVKHVIARVLERCPDEIAFLNSFVDTSLVQRLETVKGAGFARMTYTDAIVELEKVKDTFEFPVAWGCDIQTEHERYLCEKVTGRPVFVTDYPKDIKSFYMRQNEDGKTVAACDLLVAGVGELIGGSQREEREDVLRARIEELNMPMENYDWYVELRRYGTTKHGGFGIGFERLIMYLTGIANIRDVIPFPRTTGSAEF